MEITGKTPLSLYFHIPFCKKKCPYCHFFVIRDNELQKDLLLEAFFSEIELLKIPPSSSVVSIYFGGGTPSLFGPGRIKKLMDFIKNSLDVSALEEVTLEMNPEDATFDLLQRYKDASITRLSLGVQSLHDSSLVAIGRSHTSSKAVQAVFLAKEAGFNNISIDLMYDRPHQTLSEWQTELEIVKTLPITHLSLYNMTIDEGSAYKRKEAAIRKTMPSDESSLKMLEAALNALDEAGLKRYEISAFSKPGFQSVHNLGYWQGRDFYGLGPSAFSYISGTRKKNVSLFMPYIEKITAGSFAYDFEETLDQKSRLKEMLCIGLRVASGIEIDSFEKRFGKIDEPIFNALKSLEARGLVTVSNHHVALTKQGMLFYDDVGESLI